MTEKVTKDLLAAVVHYSEDSIIITTTDLDEPGPTIIYVNPGFTKITGYTSEEVIGKSPRILQGPNTDVSELKRLRSSLERGEVFRGATVNYRKDGTEFYNEWHIEPIRNDDHQVTHYIAIQQDGTDRRKAQKSLEQKNYALKEILEQIEIEKNRIKDDIRNNITQVVLPTLKKLNRKGGRLDKKYIAVLEQSLKDMTSSFGTKISDKKHKLSPREVEIANMIKNGLSSKEIAATLNIALKTVETHRNKIRRKLDLISNEANLTTYLKSI